MIFSQQVSLHLRLKKAGLATLTRPHSTFDKDAHIATLIGGFEISGVL